MKDTMPSGESKRLPRWVAPFGWRGFAPALLIAVLAFNLCLITVTRLDRPAAASGLLWLWIPGVLGAVLLCVGWRALLENAGGIAAAGAEARAPSGPP
jgi:hypothetical protein